MGLPTPVAEMMFFESQYKKLYGNIGFIGRQTTYLTERTLQYLGDKYNITAPKGFSIERDHSTLNAGQEFIFNKKQEDSLITDRCLMNFLGAENFLSIDVSNYEGADVVCDLSYQIPNNLHSKFDFIFNGSCLDNIFNPSMALSNLSKMLRPKGRLMMIEHGSFFNGPYTVFSPGWFFDFFVENNYEDVIIYAALFKDN